MLTSTALTVYAAMARSPHASVRQLVTESGLSRADVENSIEVLAQGGLLDPHEGQLPGSALLDPRLALALIAERTVWQMQQRALDVEQSTTAMNHLLRDLARAVPDQQVTTVKPAEIAAQHELMIRQANSSLQLFVGERWWAEFLRPESSAQPLLSSASERGVGINAIVATPLAELPGVRAMLEQLDSASSCRFTNQLPLNGTLVDGQRGLLLAADDAPTSHPATFINSPSVARALGALFDSTWEVSVGREAGAHSPESAPALCAIDDEIDILTLLAKGLKDQSIARHAGISLRKLTRLVQELGDHLDASTRFQMGAEASRRGLT